MGIVRLFLLKTNRHRKYTIHNFHEIKIGRWIKTLCNDDFFYITFSLFSGIHLISKIWKFDLFLYEEKRFIRKGDVRKNIEILEVPEDFQIHDPKQYSDILTFTISTSPKLFQAQLFSARPTCPMNFPLKPLFLWVSRSIRSRSILNFHLMEVKMDE